MTKQTKVIVASSLLALALLIAFLNRAWLGIGGAAQPTHRAAARAKPDEDDSTVSAATASGAAAVRKPTSTGDESY